uniref:RHS repeat-associated core domain-containing protein n=1 Tax=Streptomyces lonarensis TaxID=700599 RepID=UPI0035E454E8
MDQPHRFAGEYQDATGLYHLSARYYDPRIGRFTQPDPSGQEKNPHLYAEGDPVNRIDPTGLDWGISFSGEVCVIVCVGAGVNRNVDTGETGAMTSIGVGWPVSISGGFRTSYGYSRGGSGYGSCGAGPLSWEATGLSSGSIGTGYFSSPGCSGGYTHQF